MQSKLKLILVFSVLVLGFFLRWHNYDQVPVVGDSLDEYSFTWVGMSLIRIGIPVGAIGVGGYKNNVYKYINVDRVFQTGRYASPININWPWFDHPPLLGLVTGSFAYASGARVFEDTTLHIIRRPMVILGMISILLVMLLGYKYFGFWPAMIAGLIYATSPLIVVSSRMVQAENLLIIWILLVLISLKKEKWLWVGVFTSLAFWTKFSAVALIPVILASLKNKNNFKDFLIGCLPGMLMLAIYYWIYGLDTFWSITRANGGREYAIGTNALLDLITKTKVTNLKLLMDGWILASWLAFFGLFKKIKILNIYIISYVAIYILFGNFPHGWYAIPLWPVLFVFLGKYIADGPNILLALLPLGVRLNINNWIVIWRWGIFGILISSFLIKNIKYLKLITVVLFGLAIIINAFWVYKLNANIWFQI